jgi:hypothetical protein
MRACTAATRDTLSKLYHFLLELEFFRSPKSSK